MTRWLAFLPILIASGMSISAFADDRTFPTVTTADGEGPPRTMLPVARFFYPVDEQALLTLLPTCGFTKFSLGEYVESRRLHVEPIDLSDRKIACLKQWASAQTNLRVEWLK